MNARSVCGWTLALGALVHGCAGGAGHVATTASIDAADASVSPSDAREAAAPTCSADLVHDRAHCGRCGLACGSSAVCVAGQCLEHGGLAAGGESVCAIAADGRGHVVCWGDDKLGQAGLGRRSGMEAPRTVDGLTGVVELTASGPHVCARTSEGQVWCWGGLDEDGGHRAPVLRPARVEGLANVCAIDASWHLTCALWGAGRVSCWGESRYGVLGVRAAGYQDTPVEIPWTEPFEGITTSADVACGWDHDGHVACWGAVPIVIGRSQGFRPEPQPLPVRTVPGLVRAVAGPGFVCALDGTGRAGCWGGPGPMSHLPAMDAADGPNAAIPDAVDLARGGEVVCFLRRGGAVQCEGFGGQRLSVVDPVGAVALAVGHEVVCTRQVGDGVACWGGNASGQLGDGTLEPHDRPRPIAPAFAVQARLEGDACGVATGCALDDPCAPSRCVPAAWVGPAAATCSSATPAPGTCECLAGRCQLHPTAKPAAPELACPTGGCALDEGAGRCVRGPMHLSDPATVLGYGPSCRCDVGTQRCEHRWLDAVGCNAAADCELSRAEPVRIVPRGQGKRPVLGRGRCGRPTGLGVACVDHVCRLAHPPPTCE